jgi:hypothetical protein
MGWLFVVVMMTSEGNDRHTAAIYPTESECVAAAEAFVVQHPGFDFQHPSNDASVIHPVLRSYVECVPQTEEPRE